MSFNNRFDLILREHFQSMDDYVKKSKYPLESSCVYLGRPITSTPNTNVHGNHNLTPSPFPWKTLPTSSDSGSTSKSPLVPNDKCPHSNVERTLKYGEEQSFTEEINGYDSTPEAIGSKSKGKSTNAFVVEAFHHSHAAKFSNDIISDMENNKGDIISAMESVLNTLKAYEAKRQEASTAIAQVEDKIVNAQLNSSKSWAKLIITHFQLHQSAKKNKATLNDKASKIRDGLLLLLRSKQDTFKILNEIRGKLDLEFAKVEKEMKIASEKDQNEVLILSSEAVSSENNTISSVSAESELDEILDETSEGMCTDGRADVNEGENEVRTGSDDDWELCGNSESDE